MWEADDSQDLWSTPGNSPAASMAHGERMVGSELTAEDLDVDRTLRPQRLDDYCGQEHIKQSLRVLIEAAQSRGETLDHVIFSGPPGLGKTTLATVIANELGAQIKTTSGPAIARTGDLAAILTNLQPGDVLFIDEIHRLNRSVEEVLYPAMEDFALDIVIGKGPGGALDSPGYPQVYARSSNDPLGYADWPAARPLWHFISPGLLHGRGARADCDALGVHPGRGDRPPQCARDRLAFARHATSCQPPAQARARLRTGARQRSH